MAETFRANEAMARNARRALEVRDEKPSSQQGMTRVGLSRANQYKGRESVSLETVKRTIRYLSRHLSDKQGDTWDDQGKGWQAWQGWGGDEAGPWAAAILRREDPKWWNEWTEGERNRALAKALGFSAEPVKNKD